MKGEWLEKDKDYIRRTGVCVYAVKARGVSVYAHRKEWKRYRDWLDLVHDVQMSGDLNLYLINGKGKKTMVGRKVWAVNFWREKLIRWRHRPWLKRGIAMGTDYWGKSLSFYALEFLRDQAQGRWCRRMRALEHVRLGARDYTKDKEGMARYLTCMNLLRRTLLRNRLIEERKGEGLKPIYYWKLSDRGRRYLEMLE